MFGIDPAWYLSDKELPYINSFKMKTAVIFGVAHMVLGILIKGLNSAYCVPLTKAIKNQVEIIQLSLTDDDGYIDYLEKL